MIRIIFTLLLSLLSFLGLAQEMKMEECVRYALSNNIALSNAAINGLVAKEEYRQAKRNMLPIIESGISGGQLFGRSIDPQTNTYVSEGSILSADVYLTAQVNLFDGFKKQNSIRYTKLQYLMRQEDQSQTKMELAFKVMNSYYDVLYYEKLEQIATEQVKLTELNFQHTKKQIELGLKAESDLLEMEAQKAAEVHNQIVMKNKKETALLTLKKLMNFPVTDKLLVIESIVPLFSNTQLSIDSIYEVAYRHMPLVKKSLLNVKAGKKKLAIQRGDLYPSLSFGGNVSSSYANSWKEPIDPNNKDLGYKTVSLHDQFSDNVSKRLFLRMNIPIFSRWGSRSGIKTAKYDLEIAQNELLETERSLYQEIAENHQELTALAEEQNQLQIKQKAMKEAYRIAEKKLEQGLINVMDFYTAKNQLAHAEAELLRTQLQRIIKEKTIDFYLGKEIY